MKRMRGTIAKILLKIAKDEQKDEKDRLKACEALIKLAQEGEEKGGLAEDLRVIVEYGEKGTGQNGAAKTG